MKSYNINYTNRISLYAYNSSNEIDYFINSQESYLTDNGEIKYQNMLLEANYIHVDWNENTLNALKNAESNALKNAIITNIDSIPNNINKKLSLFTKKYL